MERDDIYLIDMWRILLREWRWFLAALMLILASTFAFLHGARPQWQAVAWVQIGQVGTAPAGQDPKVEPLQRVLERLQLVPFQNGILQSVGIGPDTPEGRLYRKSLKLEPLPYAGPLIKLSVRAYSREQARGLAEATVAGLQAVHRGLESVQLGLAHARLDDVQADLQAASAERDALQQAATRNRDAFAGLLLASKNKEIRTLKQARSDLLARLGASYTYETSLMWPVYVPQQQAFPNLALAWGMGMVCGLFLGVIVAVARNAARRRTGNASNASSTVAAQV